MEKNGSKVVPIRLGYVNAFLIEGESPVLIDAGRPGDSVAVIKKLSAMGIDPKGLSLILLTHCHLRSLRWRIGSEEADRRKGGSP